MNSRYAFPLCIQLTAPDNMYEDKAFNDILSLLKKRDFYGVELNIVDFEKIDSDELEKYLNGYNLRMTLIASGAYAKKNNFSLSSTDEALRQKSVDGFDSMVGLAAKLNAGIICGFIKGNAGEDKDKAYEALKRSVDELKRRYANSNVKILLEATNHYEATVINGLCEGANYAGDIIEILPDTYHMNIEERNMYAALVKYRKSYCNIHISDNNRYFPGYGAIDFYKVLSILKSIDYNGTISIEGRNMYSICEDIEYTADYLEGISKRL